MVNKMRTNFFENVLNLRKANVNLAEDELLDKTIKLINDLPSDEREELLETWRLIFKSWEDEDNGDSSDECEDCAFCLGRAAGNAHESEDTNPYLADEDTDEYDFNDHRLWREGWSLGREEDGKGPWYTQEKFINELTEAEKLRMEENRAASRMVQEAVAKLLAD